MADINDIQAGTLDQNTGDGGYSTGTHSTGDNNQDYINNSAVDGGISPEVLVGLFDGVTAKKIDTLTHEMRNLNSATNNQINELSKTLSDDIKHLENRFTEEFHNVKSDTKDEINNSEKTMLFNIEHLGQNIENVIKSAKQEKIFSWITVFIAGATLIITIVGVFFSDKLQ